MSGETHKYRHLTSKYLQGCGVDVGSQGEVAVPWAISFDLPEEEFLHYSSNQPPRGPIHLRGHGDSLPFDSGSLDFVYSSHLLEDFADWWPMLREWVRVLKPGGKLVIMIPDKDRWNHAVYNLGQPPNCQHRHEGHPGELSEYAPELGLDVIKDELTEQHPDDYNILFVATKK